MRRKWVTDSSPVILLAKINQSDLLPRLADELTVPEAVAREIIAGEEDDPARNWIQSAGQEFIQPVDSVSPAVTAWNLGHGESAVLSWGNKREGWTALLDDGAARRAARALGVRVSGTLGVVLAAKREGEIVRIKPLLEELVSAGLRVSDSVLEEALQQAGER